MRSVARLGFMVAAIAGVASMAFAQGGSAVIAGTVFDQGKAVLPGVTVTVTNQATGITRDAVTGAEGRFVIPTRPSWPSNLFTAVSVA